MKATKYIAAAMIAATALGVATPAFASEVGVDTSEVGVTIRTAYEGEEEFVLKTVPLEYEFESPINYNGQYAITTNSTSKMTAFKNFESGEGDKNKFLISASVSKLALNGETDEEKLINVTKFSINAKSIGGTGGSTVLYGDTDFVNRIEDQDGYQGGEQVDGKDYFIDITEAKIEFTQQGLELDDELTGTVTYSLSDVRPAD